MYPSSIKNLIESFKYLPGIGEKTAERMAFAVLNLDKDQVESFASNMVEMKNNIHKCKICNNLTEDEVCNICSNESRNKKSLVVVDDPKTVFVFENLGIYKGLYHVLDGLISPIDGVNPEDVGISQLVDRVNSGNFDEIIFAFKPSIEGETTALYIKRVLSGMNIKFSRLASGVPMGADMEYVDSLTLERALSDRKEIE